MLSYVRFSGMNVRLPKRQTMPPLSPRCAAVPGSVTRKIMKLSFVQTLSLRLAPMPPIEPAAARKRVGDQDDLDGVHVFVTWSTAVKPGANGFAAFALPNRRDVVVIERAAPSHERTEPSGPVRQFHGQGGGLAQPDAAVRRADAKPGPALKKLRRACRFMRRRPPRLKNGAAFTQLPRSRTTGTQPGGRIDIRPCDFSRARTCARG